MQPYTACVQISRFKLLICGDRGVGKTALIHAFRDDRFTEDPEESNEIVCKVHYVDEHRILFQVSVEARAPIMGESVNAAYEEMVELHVDELLPETASNAQAIMLLYDNDSEPTIKRIQEFWYSKINLYFSQIPLFLVRTKCDLLEELGSTKGKALKNSMHALRHLECSAKQMNGVKYVFLEIAAAVKPEHQDMQPDDTYLTMTTSQYVTDVLSRIGSSGPLIRQIAVNLRECVMNPSAFPDLKQSLCGILPFNIFGVEPETEVNNNRAVEEKSNTAYEVLEKSSEEPTRCSVENEDWKY